MRNIVIVGHAQHGKDTVAEMLCELLQVDMSSASLEAAPYISEAMYYLGIEYGSIDECFADRVNHRAFWGESIAMLLIKDKLKLAREVYKNGPIYCGVRRPDEFEAIVEEYDPIIVWVDAAKRKPLESEASMKLQQDQRMINLDNNGTKQDLAKNVEILARFILQN